MDDLSFANDALNEIGETALTALDDETNSAKTQTVLRHLVRVKEATLEVRDWNCARRRAELAAVTNESLGEWSASYRLPPDCLKVRRFVSDEDYIAHAAFSVEIDSSDKRILYTNWGNGKIVYTANLTDINRWDKLLYDLAVTRLAHELSKALTRDMKMALGLLEIYTRKLEEAVGVDEAEGGIEQHYDQTLVSVRY